jgi:hypothetical protein
MTSLKQFHRQRAKVVVPKSASLRPYRHIMGFDRGPLDRMLRGILSRPQRALLLRDAARRNARHMNVMDPFRFPSPSDSGRAVKSRKRGHAERRGRATQVREVLSTLDLVHRARGRIGYAPRPDWAELPVAGR